MVDCRHSYRTFPNSYIVMAGCQRPQQPLDIGLGAHRSALTSVMTMRVVSGLIALAVDASSIMRAGERPLFLPLSPCGRGVARMSRRQARRTSLSRKSRMTAPIVAPMIAPSIPLVPTA